MQHLYRLFLFLHFLNVAQIFFGFFYFNTIFFGLCVDVHCVQKANGNRQSQFYEIGYVHENVFKLMLDLNTFPAIAGKVKKGLFQLKPLGEENEFQSNAYRSDGLQHQIFVGSFQTK